ncbi:putative metal-binding motif-containing protein [Pyxidicoccus sp. 3LFB2]
MTRLSSWSVGLFLVLAGCTVPGLEDVENDQPRACDAQHGCGEGQLCLEGLCQDDPCDGATRLTAYRDADGDGHAALDATAEAFCDTVPSGYVTVRDDCDDAQALVHPGQSEVCDGVDNDCQRGIDDGLARTEYFRDADGDGVGAGEPTVVCAAGPDGYVAVGGDCDDGDRESAPGRAEVCDNKDNNCVDGVDEGFPADTYYRDADGDGVGAQADSQQSCRPLSGYVRAASPDFDCDDTDAARMPGKAEVCDGKDNDCAGGVDDGFNTQWYRDGDGDTFGRNEPPTVSCDSPGAGYVHVAGNDFDCDDTTAEVRPGAQERCNNRDDNCVGGADETFLAGAQAKGASCNNDVCTGRYVCNNTQDGTVCNAPAPASYYPDVDDDSQGDASATATRVCPPSPRPDGYVSNNTDCEDVDPNRRVGRPEFCDAIDNNCDGKVDEGETCGGTLKQVFDVRLGGNGHDWRTVAMGPNGLPVWVAGLSGKVAVRKTVGGAFQSFDGDQPNNCGASTDWYAAWVHPSDGSVFLAGSNGSLAHHSGTDCIRQATAPGLPKLMGIVGLVAGGVTTLYVTSESGHVFKWVPGSTPLPRFEAQGFSLHGIDGVSADELFIAGSVDDSPYRAQRIVTFYDLGNTMGANYFHTHAIGNMNAVCRRPDGVAYAVGDAGQLWVQDEAAGWRRILVPSSPLPDFSSIATPNSGTDGDVYLVDKGTNGKLRRVTPYGWASSPTLTAPVPLHDVAMSWRGNFWVVGDNGYVAHYPEP